MVVVPAGGGENEAAGRVGDGLPSGACRIVFPSTEIRTNIFGYTKEKPT